LGLKVNDRADFAGESCADDEVNLGIPEVVVIRSGNQGCTRDGPPIREIDIVVPQD
jgi:hypothetical protein